MIHISKIFILLIGLNYFVAISVYSADQSVTLIPVQSNYRKTINGNITKVISGDKIELTDKHGKKHTISLDIIDAPELDQPYGKESKKFVEDFIPKNQCDVIVGYSKRDKSGNILGNILVDLCDSCNCYRLSLSINILGAGFARVHPDYRDNKNYIFLEKNAKSYGFGMWENLRSTKIIPGAEVSL